MKILFVNNNMFGLNIFRGEVIRKINEKGYEVKTCSPEDDENKLKEFGIPHISINLDSKGISPLKDFKYFFDLYKIYKKEKPDLIFHYTIKPNIYGTLASKFMGAKSIAVLAGLGKMFSEDTLKSKIAKKLYKFALQFSNEVWFLNEDDREKAIVLKIVEESKTFVLPGEGINTSLYKPLSKLNKDNKIKFLMISRLLWDKGFKEYAEAAKLLKDKYPNLEFQLLGEIPKNDLNGVSIDIVKSYVDNGVLNYLGVTSDVKQFIRETDCVILPSFYREGMPRVLLEAASMGKVIITTNNVGCKEVVKDNYNGFLCEMKSTKSLVEKIEKYLALSEDEKKLFSKNSRSYVNKKYSIEIIKDIYNEKISNILKSEEKNEKNKNNII